MANDYFDGSTLTVLAGTLAEASDINDIVAAVETGFDLIASDSGEPRSSSETTATQGQTTFSVSYTVGTVYVYRNGYKLPPSEFTATNGTSVVLDTGCSLGDLVEITYQ